MTVEISDTLIITDEAGNVFYHLDGDLHREDGPACEFINGDKSWWKNGKRHRIDGPAVEYVDGDKIWYHYDKIHRIDGPAIEWANGHKWWYYEGEYIQCSSQEEFERILKLKLFW